jgi:hypothetical protein
MIPIPKVFKANLLVLAVFTLSSCDSLPKTWSRDDLNGIAYDAAEDVSSAQQSRINDLESRVDALESRANDLESRASDLESDVRSLQY